MAQVLDKLNPLNCIKYKDKRPDMNTVMVEHHVLDSQPDLGIND